MIDLIEHVTYAAALPKDSDLYQSLSVMNAQAQQVRNFLYIVGGYGWSNNLNRNTTYDTVSIQRVHVCTEFTLSDLQLSVIDVDKVIGNIYTAAESGKKPNISECVLQTRDRIFEVKWQIESCHLSAII